MNLFIVPSWYPSDTNPSYGIFVKEQIEMMTVEKPDWKIGVSTWGQGDNNKLLWVKDHFNNFGKFHEHRSDRSHVSIQKGYTEYYQPALSWSKKILKGNLKKIIHCNEQNYLTHLGANGKPNVLMVQACYPGILIADYLSTKYDIPIYLHIRLGGFMFKNMLEQLGRIKSDLLHSISRTSTIVGTSAFHANELRHWVSNVSVLNNPVDMSFFDLNGETSNYAIAIGRLEEEKGFDLLLDAVAEVPSIKFKIIGEGSQKTDLVQKAKKLGLDSRIAFIGEADRREVRELIQKAQFLVLPSYYETYGNVLLEAMACGKPIVATKCGGAEEIVTSEVGYLSEINAKELAIKIKEMNEHYGQFQPRAIRSVVEEKYSPKVWIAQLEKLLISTCEK